MAKTTAPILSMGGAGQIGKTQVYATWRGVPYARRYVIPANPQTANQTQTRGVFSWLNAVWKLMDAQVQGAWTAFAKGKPLIDRNAFIKSNLPALNGPAGDPLSVITTFIASPGANAGIAAGGLATADATGHDLTATLTAPTLPAGWTITLAIFILLKQQDAHGGAFTQSTTMTKDASAWEVTFDTGAAGTYVVSGFFKYTKPDGSVAYSPSITAAQVLA